MGRETDLGALIEHISQRPNMYIGSSNLNEVATFVEGFSYGNEIFWNEIRSFNKWLSIKLKFPSNWAWWSGLEKKYPNSDDALIELPKLFREFRVSRD